MLMGSFLLYLDWFREVVMGRCKMGYIGEYGRPTEGQTQIWSPMKGGDLRLSSFRERHQQIFGVCLIHLRETKPIVSFFHASSCKGTLQSYKVIKMP